MSVRHPVLKRLAAERDAALADAARLRAALQSLFLRSAAEASGSSRFRFTSIDGEYICHITMARRQQLIALARGVVQPPAATQEDPASVDVTGDALPKRGWDATRLVAARKKANLTQSELGALCSCAPAAVAHWESGRRVPDTASIVKLAVALGLSADYLLGLTPEPARKRRPRQTSRKSRKRLKTRRRRTQARVVVPVPITECCKHLSHEQKTQIVALFDGGMTNMSQIARMVGCASYQIVRTHLEHAGRRKRRSHTKSLTRGEKNRIVALFDGGLKNKSEIARLVGCTYVTVQRHLSKLGMQPEQDPGT